MKSLDGPEILHIATHGYFIADWDSAIGSGDSQRLREGRGRSEALRLAQLDMLSQAATSHPFYWASFVVSGDWRPLR